MAGPERAPPGAALRCPSAPPESSDSELFGIVTGTAEQPETQFVGLWPVTPELLALAEPVRPTEVFRFTGKCIEQGCGHFRNGRCGVAAVVVDHLPPVVGGALPKCGIRPECRWWHEQGVEACRRCPCVVTEDTARSGPYREAMLAYRARQ